MRAYQVSAAGEQPQLSDLPTPVPTAGTVLIRVKAAGLNPIDNAVAAGMLAHWGLPYAYPVVIGRDAAGIVEAVGEGVDHVKVGDEVLGHVLLAPPISAGTLAEYALLPAAAVTLKPAGLDFTTAAALPLAGASAVQVIDKIDPQPDQTVLVNGASGGVGSFVVQLLAARGVKVVATGKAADNARLKDLGATQVVDHTAGPVADQVRALYPDGVDALINLHGMDPSAVPLGAVRQGGKVSGVAAVPDEATLSAAGLTGGSVMAMPLREVLAPLAEQAASGKLKVAVSEVLSLERAAEGLGRLATGGAGGKLVVTLQD
ncbi:NADP-dependent oxidoreductase [Deinococcus cellulosilyticus]|uniref:NADPH:quinone reductase n=1 Tax=Deinococcus cellulosilyticus (strain DSM 18568 / NBRC 106333 / KACC 11606 / 5516J-15) TaxID=1223518 RepID=A0A511N869_DEIC1|nr:NADP-dependent oxidoreductase [Deinococcus cellulosilyticus]GEM48676.1 NADPH:quinone reductase [Deinococcus cellulosilyticus NBRC 106333 = KACC 11606]